MTDQIKSKEAIKFLEMLDPNTDQFCFRTFEDNPDRNNKGLIKKYENIFKNVENELVKLNELGAGIFVVVNDGGNTDKEIDKIRVLFADTDGAPVDPLISALKPHIVIKTSPNKFHVYWIVSDCEVRRFKPIQKAIANKYSTDASVNNPSRVMRLPGFFHKKSKPFLSNIIQANTNLPSYTVDQVVKGLGISVDNKNNEVVRQNKPLQLGTATNSNLSRFETYIIPDEVPDGGRNSALMAHVGYLRQKAFSEKKVTKLAHKFNQEKCKPPMDNSEVDDIISRYAPDDEDVKLIEDDWGTPEELGSELLSVKPFDYNMLPDVLVPFVKDCSERMGHPPDFFAVPLMITAAAALGAKWAVCPRAQDKSWRESSVLWGGVVASPGSKKSTCIKTAARPIFQIEKKLTVAHQKKYEQYLIEKQKYDLIPKKQKLAAPLTAVPTEPILERALIQDISYQKVAELMSVSPCGLLVYLDEIASLVTSWDTKGQESARSFFLTAWNGDSPYSVDRISRERNLIKRAYACIVGGVQPSILAEYIRRAKSGGLNNDGMIERFQLLVYPDFDPEQEAIDRKVDEDAEVRAYEAIEGLRCLNPNDFNFKSLKQEDRSILHFDTQAQCLVNKLEKKIKNLATSGQEEEMMASHLNKMPGTVFKLAMLIHLIDGGKGPITLKATKKASQWGVYLRSHAKRIHHLSENGITTLAKRLGSFIIAGKLEEPFTASEISKKGWGGFTNPQVAAEVIKTLEKANWVRSITMQGNGPGKPTARYEANPALREKK